MSKIDPNKPLPEITKRTKIASSRFFTIEQVDLRFSNGATREFERMSGTGRGAVMIVALTSEQNILLIREYGAGTHSYQLGFPKGLIDPGETPEQAANRELQEEAGFAAHSIKHLHTVQMAPTFFNANMHIMLASKLEASVLPGDEPEPLEVIAWPVSEIDALLSRPDFNEARSIAALLLLQRHLNQG